jgi:hypothetical protein
MGFELTPLFYPFIKKCHPDQKNVILNGVKDLQEVKPKQGDFSLHSE